MADAMLEFLGSYKPRLIRMIQDYLAQRLSHEELKHLAWEIIDAWSGLTYEVKAVQVLTPSMVLIRLLPEESVLKLF